MYVGTASADSLKQPTSFGPWTLKRGDATIHRRNASRTFHPILRPTVSWNARGRRQSEWCFSAKLYLIYCVVRTRLHDALQICTENLARTVVPVCVNEGRPFSETTVTAFPGTSSNTSGHFPHCVIRLDRNALMPRWKAGMNRTTSILYKLAFHCTITALLFSLQIRRWSLE